VNLVSTLSVVNRPFKPEAPDKRTWELMFSRPSAPHGDRTAETLTASS